MPAPQPYLPGRTRMPFDIPLPDQGQGAAQPPFPPIPPAGDQREQLAQMMMGFQGGQQPGGAPSPYDSFSEWTPTPTSPFGGLDQTNWKEPGLPHQTGTLPIGPTQQDINDMTGVYNSMRARGELPFDVNPQPQFPPPNAQPGAVYGRR